MKKIAVFCLCVVLIAAVMPDAFAKTIKAPTNLKVSAKVKGFTVRFTKSKSNITGYKLQYALSKSFNKAKTISLNKNTTEKNVKSLKSGKRYYIRVRAYKGLLKSKWSKVKSVKTKKKPMTETAARGLWYLYSPQDTVADVFNLYSNGSCKHMFISCNGNKVKQYKSTIVCKCKIDVNKMTVYEGSNKYVIKYVKSGDYGKYTTMLSSGPMEPEKVTFKVYHYSDHPSGKKFMNDWKNKFIK